MTNPIVTALTALLTAIEDDDLPIHDVTILGDGSFNIGVNTDDELACWAVFLESEPVLGPMQSGGLAQRVGGTTRGHYWWVGSRQVHTSAQTGKEVPA